MRVLLIALVLFSAATIEAQQPAKAVTYEIGGTVVNALTAQPLDAVEVTVTPVSGRGKPQTATTGSDGRFLFRGFTRGKYSLSAQRRGFSMQAYEQHEAYSSAIVVGPEIESTAIVFRLEPDASISGLVTEEHNDPVANARIMLFRDGIESGHRSVRLAGGGATNDLGAYRIGHLRPGKYYVAVVAQPWVAEYLQPRFGRMRDDAPATAAPENRREFDLAYPITYFGDVTDSAEANPIEVAAGERASANVTLREVPAAHLRLLSPSGVQWREFRRFRQPAFPGTDIDLPTRTMSSGQVTEIVGIPPGHYRFDISGVDAKDTPRHFRRDVEVSGDTEIDLAQDGPTTNVDGTLQMQPAAAQPNNVSVLLQSRTGSRVYFARVGPNGEFRFDESPVPGTYFVVVGGGGGGATVVTSLSASGARVDGTSVEIGAGDAHLEVVARVAHARIDGVAVRDGKAYAGAMVVLVPADIASNLPLVRRDQSDSDGTFTLSGVAPGRYTVVAFANWKVEWANPAGLKRWLAGGTVVEVGSGPQVVKVAVQE